jgi:hypothetical protein
MYCSVVTPSFKTQIVFCVHAGLLAFFDATYMRQRRSGLLSCISFGMPVALPTAEFGMEQAGGLTYPFSAAFVALAVLAPVVAFSLRHNMQLAPDEAAVPNPRIGLNLRPAANDAQGQSQSAASRSGSRAKTDELLRRRPVSKLLDPQALRSTTFSPKSKPAARRPRKITDSQKVAAALYEQSQEEDRRAAAAAAAREQETAAEIAARRTKRDAALSQRQQLQDAVQEAAKSLAFSRRNLVAAVDDARRKGEARARAGSQARTSPGDAAAQAELHRCFEEASVAEHRQQAVLDDVNAASARLADLRDEVSRLPSIPHLLDNID